MITKEEKPIFARLLVVIMFIFILNVGLILYSYGNFSTGFTGNAISDTISKAYRGTSFIERIALIAQWVILFLLMAMVLYSDKKVRAKIKEVKEVKIVKNETATDIDALYDLLKQKNQLSISTVSKSFKVSKEVVMIWAKILEEANLTEISYPYMGEPVLKLINK